MASWRFWAASVGHAELAYGRLAAALTAGASGVLVDGVEALERYTNTGQHRQLLGQAIDDDLSQVVCSSLLSLVKDVSKLARQAAQASQPVYVALGLPADPASESLAGDLVARSAPEAFPSPLIGLPASAAGSLIAARLLERGHDVLVRAVSSADELVRLIDGAAQAVRRADPEVRPSIVALSADVWPAVQAVAQRLDTSGEGQSPLPTATLRWLLRPYIEAFRQARERWLSDPVLAPVTLLLVLEDASPAPAQANWWRAVTGWESDLILAPAISCLQEVRQLLALGLPQDLPATDEALQVSLLGRDLTLEALRGLPASQLHAAGWQRVLEKWRLDRESGGSVQAGALQEALLAARRELADDHSWARLIGRQPTLVNAHLVFPDAASEFTRITLPAAMHRQLAEVDRLTAAIRRDGFTDLLLLAGPGAGATAALLHEAFGPMPKGLALTVLDCAAPQAVERVAAALPGERTVVLVVSQSGAQTQVHDLVSYFQPWVARHLGSRWPEAFVAVTARGSSLAERAVRETWRSSLETPPDLPERCAELATAGLVPLVLSGHDPSPLLDQALRLRDDLACGQEGGVVELCALLTAAARTGRNKVSIYADGVFGRWPSWLDTQIARALGQGDQGLVPVVGEGMRQGYGQDRLFISFGQGDAISLSQLAEAGHPTARFQITDAPELGREMVRFQTALAGVSMLVEGSVIQEFAADEVEAETTRLLAANGAEMTELDRREAGPEQAIRAIEKMVRALPEGGHVRVSAYLDPESEQAAVAAEFRSWLAGLTMAPVTFGFGLSGVSSEGQFHPPRWRSCALVQLLDASARVPIPGRRYGFAELVRAQARAERMALEKRGRPVVTVEVGELDAAFVRHLVDTATAQRRS